MLFYSGHAFHHLVTIKKKRSGVPEKVAFVASIIASTSASVRAQAPLLPFSIC